MLVGRTTCCCTNAAVSRMAPAANTTTLRSVRRAVPEMRGGIPRCQLCEIKTEYSGQQSTKNSADYCRLCLYGTSAQSWQRRLCERDRRLTPEVPAKALRKSNDTIYILLYSVFLPSHATGSSGRRQHAGKRMPRIFPAANVEQPFINRANSAADYNVLVVYAQARTMLGAAEPPQGRSLELRACACISRCPAAHEPNSPPL